MYSKFQAACVTFVFTGLLVSQFVNKTCERQDIPIWPGLVYVIGSGVITGLLVGAGMYLALWHAEKGDHRKQEKDEKYEGCGKK